jgi:hypothetical protein
MKQSHSFNQLSIFLHAPAKSGVYLLRTSARCVYVGETENIRKSLLAHLHGDSPWINLWAPSGFSFELCSDESRVQLKNKLSVQLRPAVGHHDCAVAIPDLSGVALQER